MGMSMGRVGLRQAMMYKVSTLFNSKYLNLVTKIDAPPHSSTVCLPLLSCGTPHPPGPGDNSLGKGSGARPKLFHPYIGCQCPEPSACSMSMLS